METISSFRELSSNPFTRRILEELYGDVNNLDAFVGGLAEDPLPDAPMGSLFYASIKDQFQRIRDGDRLFYANTENGLFSKEQIAEIESTGLRNIILRNTNIQVVPLLRFGTRPISVFRDYQRTFTKSKTTRFIGQQLPTTLDPKNQLPKKEQRRLCL